MLVKLAVVYIKEIKKLLNFFVYALNKTTFTANLIVC